MLQSYLGMKGADDPESKKKPTNDMVGIPNDF